MTLVVLRIVNDVSYVRRVKHARHFAWQAQYLVRLDPRIVNDVSYVRRIKHARHFAWQGQYFVRLDGDTCCSAQCK